MNKIIPFTKNIKLNKASLPLVIGFFDGIHKGHQKLFKNLNRHKFNILTFINVPGKPNNFIFTDKQRIENLGNLLPNSIFVLDLQKSNMQAMTFVYILCHKIKPSCVVVGNDFKFGRARSGDVKQLKKYFNVRNIPIQSSYKTSQIKLSLLNGDVKFVNESLTSPYTIIGKVQHGKHQGCKLGYRTANIALPNNIVQPKEGSYLGYTYFDGKKYKSAVFIKNHLLETHLFNFNKNIYGKTINVVLIKYHKQFDKVHSFNELKKIINIKVKEIKCAF
ncbi:MAG: hypothetical protein LBS76_01580 [Mycoplasmataceae bacterium]|jgi:riboflavin kinase/FMN adenylyltransferase|nr:hypothetical protein [Mycoplasmataceae bacterium]